MHLHHVTLACVLVSLALPLVFLLLVSASPSSSTAFFSRGALPRIRAVVYAPASTSTRAAVDLPDLYIFSSRHTHLRDLPLLATMGATHLSLPSSAFHESAPHSHFLSLAHAHNLSVMLPFSPAFPYSPPSSYDVLDIRPSSLLPIVTRFRTFLRRHQSHPSAALWVIAPPPTQAPLTPSALRAHLSLCQALTRVRDEECAGHPRYCHPLTTDLGDRPPQFVLDPLGYLAAVRSLEVVMLRYYQQASGVTSYVSAFLRHQRRTRSAAPLLLLVAADAWDMRAAVVNGTMQRRKVERLVEEVEKASAKSGGVLGVVVEEWVDGWWRSADYDRPMRECGGDADGRSTGGKARRRSDENQPVCGWVDEKGKKGEDDGDGFTSISFLGLTALDPTHALGCISPRPAFFALMALWGKTAVGEARQAGWCEESRRCCVVDANRGGWVVLGMLTAVLVLGSCAYAGYRRRRQRRLQLTATAARIARDKVRALTAFKVPVTRLSDWVARSVYDTALSLSSTCPCGAHHVAVVHELVTCLLSQACARAASASDALSLVHARVLSSYRAWCEETHQPPALPSIDAPTAALLLSEVSAYLLLWVACEQLRRVPSFVCSVFHHRHTFSFAPVHASSTASINSYQLNYDDLEALHLRPPSPSLVHRLRRLWSAADDVFAYPLLGGWSGLVLAVWPMLSFHVLMYIVLLGVLREDDRVEEGLLDVGYHLMGDRGAATWRLVAIADVAMLVAYQLLDAVVTGSFRLKKALIVVGGAKVLSLLSALSGIPFLATVDVVMRLTPSPSLPVSWVTAYLGLRTASFLVGSLFRLFTRHAYPALPGQLDRVVPVAASSFDDVTAPSPLSPPPAVHVHTVLRRVGQSCWLLTRLLSFWSLVLVSKALFDLYVLMPSVSGLTLSTLCPPVVGEREFSARFAREWACPLFFAALHAVTGMISLATTYIAHIGWTSVAGAVVPRMYEGVDKDGKTAAAAGMVLGTAALLVGLVVGGVWAGVSFAVVAVGVALAMGGLQRKGGWEECADIVSAAAEHSATDAVPPSPSPSHNSQEAKTDTADSKDDGDNPLSPVSPPPVAIAHTQATHGIRHLLQAVFHHLLSLEEAACTWATILHHMHQEDLLPSFHLSASSPLSLSHPAFLSSSLLSSLPSAVLDRVLFLLRSLTTLRRKDPLRVPSLATMQGVSVLIPMNGETVLYGIPELLRDERVREGAVDDAGCITLIEFLVEKHRDEWANLAERIGFAPSTSPSHNAETLLDAFIAVHTRADAVAVAAFARYTEAIILWCSYRGQTLARTLRGLSYTRTALMHLTPGAREVDVDAKVQIVVAAQRYGVDARQRAEMRTVMTLLPWVQVVYDHDVRRWQEERVRRRGREREEGRPAVVERMGPAVDQRFPAYDAHALKGVDEQRGKDALDARRLELHALQQQALERLTRGVGAVLLSMCAVSGVGRGGPTEEMEEKRGDAGEEAKEAAAVEDVEGLILGALQSVAATPLSQSSSTVQAHLEWEDACAVVWYDVVDEVERELRWMEQLELQRCQEELHSAATSGCLSPANQLHAIHVHQRLLLNHRTLHDTGERYRHQLIVLLRQHRDMRAASLVLQDTAARLDVPPPAKTAWPTAVDCTSTEARMRLLERALDDISVNVAACLTAQGRQTAVCDQQRSVVLDVLRAMQTVLEEDRTREVPGLSSAASPAAVFTLSALQQLSRRWVAFALVVDQHRPAQHRHQLCSLLHRTLASLPMLLMTEEQRISEWLRTCPALVQLSPHLAASRSYSVLLRELQQSLQAQTAELSRLRLLTSDSHSAMKAWMRSYMGAAPFSCAVPHPPLPVLEAASFSPLLPTLISLCLSLLHSRLLPALISGCSDLSDAPSVHPPSLPLDRLFAQLRLGSTRLTLLTVHALALMQRSSFTIADHCADPALTSVGTAISALHSAFLTVAVHPFHSVLITHSLSPSHREPVVLRSLPRHSPLLLGHLPHLPHPTPSTNPKSENQLHALPFLVHPLLQSIDMNQSFTFEEALKVPLFLSSLQPSAALRSRFVLAGCGEWIYSDRMTAVGGFMAQQDTSFVTVCQRVLDYAGVRLHYGHPDVFCGYFVRGHIGMSKASAGINLSEDLFFGLDFLQRGESSTYCQWIRYGKGREVALSTLSIFEDKLSRGAALTLRSRDLYRLSAHLDALTQWSVLVGGLGHFLVTALFGYGVVSFVYIVLLMSIARVTSEAIGLLGSVYAIPWIFHLGLLLALPLLAHCLLEHGLVSGAYIWARQVVLGSLYYLFQLRTKARGLEVGLAGVSGGYVGTGRGMGLWRAGLVGLYEAYGRSHGGQAVHLMALLAVYVGFVSTEAWGAVGLRVWAVLLACLSWTVAPALFNPALDVAGEEGNGSFKRWAEWAALRQWMRGTSLTCDSGAGAAADWEQWWWREKRSTITQHGVRYHVTAHCGWRRAAHHPAARAVSAVLGCAVTHAPMLFVAFALLQASAELLLPLAVYAAVIAAVARTAPSHFLFPLVLFLLAYATALTVPAMHGNAGYLLPASLLIHASRAREAASVVVAAAMVALVASRLVVTGVDAWWVWRVHAGRGMSVKVPAFYRAVMGGRWGFGVWTGWERWLCPSVIGAVQLGVGLLCEWYTEGHSRWMYGVDLRRLREGRCRRAAHL